MKFEWRQWWHWCYYKSAAGAGDLMVLDGRAAQATDYWSSAVADASVNSNRMRSYGHGNGRTSWWSSFFVVTQSCDGVSGAPVAFSKWSPTPLNSWNSHRNRSQGTKLGSASLISQWSFNHKIGDGAIREGWWSISKFDGNWYSLGIQNFLCRIQNFH